MRYIANLYVEGPILETFNTECQNSRFRGSGFEPNAFWMKEVLKSPHAQRNETFETQICQERRSILLVCLL